MRRRRSEDATLSPVAVMTPELRDFLAQGWKAVDRELFGSGVDWTSHPVVIVARAGGALRGTLLGLASGEAVAGMARLHDLMVRPQDRGRGLGSRLVEAFCARAAELGAARCFLRSPDTDRHRRFYERLRFTVVARIPRYYHGHDFLEYLREPLTAEPR
jgi:ribosomal protein S18 acetylase RimI-like enzyme